MAYRSSGTNNDEMVDNLKRFGVIRTDAVEHGFRAVDRKHFIPQNRPEMAHADQPLKEGNIHISAPHIYGSVVEALDLAPNQSMSFLNLGSGTNYLTCIVAEILGPTSNCYGVEIHQDVVQHSQESTERWRAHRASQSPGGDVLSSTQIEVIRGNALQIDNTKGESLVGFDRIYIGASVEKKTLSTLANMLRPGGVLVGPVDDELVKVIRIGSSQSSASPPEPTSLAPRSVRGRTPTLSQDFTLQVISSVRFSRLVSSPSMTTVIRSRVWQPSLHRYYPPSFRESCKEILLCARAPSVQPQVEAPVKHGVNVASKLPRALWMEILSYTHRDWFEQPRSEADFLRRRLLEEQDTARRAQEARLEAEARLHMAERERDVYRLLALRWQARLQAALNERSGGNTTSGINNGEDTNQEVDEDPFLGLEDFSQASTRIMSNEALLLDMGGIGAMIRRFQADDDDDDEDDDDNEEADEDEHRRDGNDDNLMEEEADMDEETESEDEATTTMDDGTEDPDEMTATTVSTATEGNLHPARSQVRTVSISSEHI